MLVGTPNKPFRLKARDKQVGKPPRGDQEKYAAGWDRIFGDKKDEMRNEAER